MESLALKKIKGEAEFYTPTNFPFGPPTGIPSYTPRDIISRSGARPPRASGAFREPIGTDTSFLSASMTRTFRGPQPWLASGDIAFELILPEDLGVDRKDFKSEDIILSVISLNGFLSALENAQKIDPKISANKIFGCFFMLGVIPISNAENLITYGRDFNPNTVPSTTVMIRGAVSVINYWRGLPATLAVGVWVGFILKRERKTRAKNVFRTNQWAAKMLTPEELYRTATSEERSNEEMPADEDEEGRDRLAEDSDPYTYPFQLIPWVGYGSPSLKELEFKNPVNGAKMYGKYIPIGWVAHYDTPRNSTYRQQYAKAELTDITHYNTNLQIILAQQY